LLILPHSIPLDHKVVKASFESVFDDDIPLNATSYVICETLGLIQHRLGLKIASRFTENMLPLVQIHWVREDDHELAWRILMEVRKRSFTIVDASSVAFMRRVKTKRILALDPEYPRLGFEMVPG